ncbi:unnamed protein product [Caenorhabditis nigoni]
MATNGEGNIGSGKEPTSTEMLKNIQALEDLKMTVTEEINRNKKNFDELSDWFQSMEASISKLLQLNEAAQSSKTSKTSTNLLQNTTNVASKTVKSFQLKHVFKDVSNFMHYERHYSEWEHHCNTKWKMSVMRNEEHLGFFIYCEPIALADNWSIRTKLEFKVVGPNQNDVIRTWQSCYGESKDWGFNEFLKWEDMEKWFLVEGKLTVEAKVTIVETTGLAKPKVRKFDESQKDVSDVILVVRDTNFYVSKMFLASQSDVFKALLFGNFSESKQSEVKLNGSDPDDFHYFLEVLYGESAIDDTTVEGVALLADMYDAPTAIRRCEEFLLEKSKKKLGEKLEIATRYNLENLKEKCMSEITILEDQAARAD